MLYIFSEYDPSGDTLSILSLESQATAASSVYTKYSKSRKWSHAKPKPLSTDVPPTTHDRSSNNLFVEMRNQATRYETQEPTQSLNRAVEQDLPLPFTPASSSIRRLASVTPIELDLMPSLPQDVPASAAQQYESAIITGWNH